MFIRDFIHVDQPFEVVAPRFVSDTAWLVPIAEAAATTARDVATQVARGAGGDGPNPTPSRAPVRCEVGPVRARAGSILVPLWLISAAIRPRAPRPHR